MSRISSYQCDACGKTIEPVTPEQMMSDERVNAPITIKAASADYEDKYPRIPVVLQIMSAMWITTVHEGKDRLDFCNLNCLVDYIRNHVAVLASF